MHERRLCVRLTRHTPMTFRSVIIAICVAAVTAANAAAQTPPPAPTLVAPSNGASAVQPVTLQWTAVSDPDGPIGSYSWQVATTSAFSVVIADGFTDVRNGDPIPTFARLSGVANGTYFWRVKATQNVGGATGAIDSPWSAVRTLMITGLGPAPGTPSFTAPANLSQFHALENFDITWTAVPNAQYYLLEADDEPSFSAPQTLTLDPLQFGTTFRAGWGNEIANVYYRVRAVSVDNVRGLPSATLNVKIVNTAPVGPAPTVQSPVGGATVSVPFMFNWTDTPNPQVSAYDLDVDTDPNFAGSFGVLLVQGVNRSDYVVAHDVPLPPGTYFWRVRAEHGAVAGPWSASGSFRVVARSAVDPARTRDRRGRRVDASARDVERSGADGRCNREDHLRHGRRGSARDRDHSRRIHRRHGRSDHDDSRRRRNRRRSPRRLRDGRADYVVRHGSAAVQPGAEHGQRRRREPGHRHHHAAASGAVRRDRRDDCQQ